VTVMTESDSVITHIELDFALPTLRLN
jgi:hypothetical protein